MNTKISYLYRDADNYKVHNECIVSGTLSEEQQKIILECLDCGEYFVPHMVGLPETKFREETEADHIWFELDFDGFQVTTDEPTVSISADELVDVFKQCKGNWENELFNLKRGRVR